MPTKIGTIKREVANYFGVRLHELTGKERNMWLSRPRGVAMYLARKITRAPYAMVGKWFGGRDHSTVISAVQKVEWLRERDGSTREAITAIESRLTALEPA